MAVYFEATSVISQWMLVNFDSQRDCSEGEISVHFGLVLWTLSCKTFLSVKTFAYININIKLTQGKCC